MAKTQHQRRADNNWKRMWDAEMKRNREHTSNKILNAAKSQPTREIPQYKYWSQYDPNKHTDYYNPNRVNPNNMWDGDSIPW